MTWLPITLSAIYVSTFGIRDKNCHSSENYPSHNPRTHSISNMNAIKNVGEKATEKLSHPGGGSSSKSGSGQPGTDYGDKGTSFPPVLFHLPISSLLFPISSSLCHHPPSIPSSLLPPLFLISPHLSSSSQTQTQNPTHHLTKNHPEHPGKIPMLTNTPKRCQIRRKQSQRPPLRSAE